MTLSYVDFSKAFHSELLASKNSQDRKQVDLVDKRVQNNKSLLQLSAKIR